MNSSVGVTRKIVINVLRVSMYLLTISKRLKNVSSRLSFGHQMASGMVVGNSKIL